MTEILEMDSDWFSLEKGLPEIDFSKALSQYIIEDIKNDYNSEHWGELDQETLEKKYTKACHRIMNYPRTKDPWVS